jgi:hypothetical protein
MPFEPKFKITPRIKKDLASVESVTALLDSAKLDKTEAELGVPVTKDNRRDYGQGTFGTSELSAAGISQDQINEFASKKKLREQALGGVFGAQQYLPTGLSVFEDALKTKAGIGQFQPGGSDLYGTLGIKGYGALTADLAQKAKEQE